MTNLSFAPFTTDPWALPQSPAGTAPDAEFDLTPQTRIVLPLDQQLGVWPKKPAPDAIRSDIFGPPWAFSYAVVDAAHIEGLDQQLGARNLDAQPLFDGELAESAASAPWLVALSEDDRFTRILFTAGHVRTALWDAGCGLFLRSNLPFARVRANLRKITQFYDEDSDKQVFLRFWDPLYARYLLAHGSDEMRLRLLQSGPMMMRGAEADEFLIWSLPDHTQPRRPKIPFRLHAQDRHALAIAQLDDFVNRALQWLRSSYGNLPDQVPDRRFVLELTLHARDTLGLETERSVSDYIAASWLLRMPAERHLDLHPLRHELPEATMARIHDNAYDVFKTSK